MWFLLEFVSVVVFLLYVINVIEVKCSVLVGIVVLIKYLVVCFYGLFLNIFCIEFFFCFCICLIWRLVSSYRKRFLFKGEIFFFFCGKLCLMWGKLFWWFFFKFKYYLDMVVMFIWEKWLFFGLIVVILLVFLF